MISVIIPTYIYQERQLQWLKECLDSIKIALRGLEGEIIIVDDGSPIKFESTLRLEQNHGVGFALNECLKLAKGDVIIRVDSDDRIASGYFNHCLKHLEKYDAVFHSVMLFSDNGKTGTEGTIDRPQVLCAKKIVFDKIGVFKEVQVYEDTLFMEQCFKNVKSFHCIISDLYYYRQWNGSTVRRNLGKLRKSQGEEK